MQTTISTKLNKKEKANLANIAKRFGMTISEYVRYKLIDQNPDLSTVKSIYHCPSGEHYNYVMDCFSMVNFMLLDSLIKTENGQEGGVKIINKSISDSKSKLEKIYGYRKVKDKNDE